MRASFAVMGLTGGMLVGCSSARHQSTRVSYMEPGYSTPTTYTYSGVDASYSDTTPAYDRDSMVTETHGYKSTQTASTRTAAPPYGATVRPVNMPEYAAVRHDITLDDLRTHIRDGSAVIVDARPSKDFRKGHVTGALNIPTGEENTYIAKFQKDVAPDQLVIVYCGGPDCLMGDSVATYLTQQGYTNVKVYRPGWQELSRTELGR